MQFSGELNIFNAYMHYSQQQKKDAKNRYLVAKFERLVDQINDLYRYSVSKDRILRENRWNEWVQLKNLETQRYLSVEQAVEKIKKIISVKHCNAQIRENRRTMRVNRQENAGYCDILTNILFAYCDLKPNLTVPYLEEYSFYSDSDLQSLQKAVAALAKYVNINQRYTVEQTVIRLDLTKDTEREISSHFLHNEFFDIFVEERSEKTIRIKKQEKRRRPEQNQVTPQAELAAKRLEEQQKADEQKKKDEAAAAAAANSKGRYKKPKKYKNDGKELSGNSNGDASTLKIEAEKKA